jgi:hypothetical protein
LPVLHACVMPPCVRVCVPPCSIRWDGAKSRHEFYVKFEGYDEGYNLWLGFDDFTKDKDGGVEMINVHMINDHTARGQNKLFFIRFTESVQRLVLRLICEVHGPPPPSPRTTHHAPRAPTTHHAPCTVHHVPRTVHHAPHTTHHAPRTVHHALCISLPPSFRCAIRCASTPRATLGKARSAGSAASRPTRVASTPSCTTTARTTHHTRTVHHAPRTTHRAPRTVHRARPALLPACPPRALGDTLFSLQART